MVKRRMIIDSVFKALSPTIPSLLCAKCPQALQSRCLRLTYQTHGLYGTIQETTHRRFDAVLVLFCVTGCDRRTDPESTIQEVSPVQHTHQRAAG